MNDKEWFEILWWNDTYERFEANHPAEAWQCDTLEDCQVVVRDCYDDWKKTGDRLCPYKIIKVTVVQEDLSWFEK